MCLGIDRIRVHRNLREELVDQAEQPWIIGTEGCLQKRRGYISSGDVLGTRSKSWITFRRIFRAFFEGTAQRGPERRRRIIF